MISQKQHEASAHDMYIHTHLSNPRPKTPRDGPALSCYRQVVVALAVGDGRPFVKRLWVGFSEPPLTHLSLEALSGMDIANLPVLRKHLRHVVMRCLMPLTEPRYSM